MLPSPWRFRHINGQSGSGHQGVHGSNPHPTDSLSVASGDESIMLQTSALPESNHRMPQLPWRLGDPSPPPATPPLSQPGDRPSGSHSVWEVERLGPGSPCGASARWPPRGILSPLPALSHLPSIATPRAPVSEISGSCPSPCLPSILCALLRGPVAHHLSPRALS